MTKKFLNKRKSAEENSLSSADKFIQKNIESETGDSDFETYLDYFVKFIIGKEYVLFGLSDANDMGQFNMVSVDTFNSICDFSKYTVIRLKRFEIEYIGKIKRINGLYNTEVVTVNKRTIDTGFWELESFLYKQNYDDDYITVIKKNNIVTKYYRQAVYNILSASGIPIKKSWNYNINLNAVKEQQEYMSNKYDVFNLTEEQTTEFTEDMILPNFIRVFSINSGYKWLLITSTISMSCYSSYQLQKFQND